MVKDLEHYSKINRHNFLVEARYKLSINEQKILYALISVLNKEEKNELIKFKIKELVDFCNIKGKDYLKELEKLTDKIMGRVLTIRNIQTGDWEKFNWLAISKKNKEFLEFKLNQELIPYICNLKKAFLYIDIKDLMYFNSVYSMRIYELLIQYLKIGERKISVQEFREILGIKQNEYPLFANLKQKVIEKSLKEINDKTNYSVKVNYIKTGRKITDLKFVIHREKEGSYEEQLEEMGQTNILDSIDETTATTEQTTILYPYLNYDVAIKFIKENGEEYCKAQLDYMLANAKSNKVAFLLSSLNNDWAGYKIKKVEEQEKAERIKRAEEFQKEQLRALEENMETVTTNINFEDLSGFVKQLGKEIGR